MGLFLAEALRWTKTVASATVTIAVISLSLLASTELTGYNRDLSALEKERETCTCECWDARYRGAIGDSKRWKPVYFNYDFRTVLLFGIFILFAGLLQTCVTRIASLTFTELALLIDSISGTTALPPAYSPRNTNTDLANPKPSVPSLTSLLSTLGVLNTPPARMRWWVLPGLILSIYATFYGTWSVLNYINDRDARMLASQIFFVATELVAITVYHFSLACPPTDAGPRAAGTGSVAVYEAVGRSASATAEDRMIFRRVPVSMGLSVLTVSALHLALAFPEKILWSILGLEKEARRGLNVRDVLLSSGDLYGVVFGLWVISRVYRREEYVAVGMRRGMLCVVLWLALYTFYQLFCAFEL
ncbi:hypothetical protein BJ742DRAFT_95025 [Cladochytrium replicatum]|nr:hypothetical protein BJ742DRAFT_95025 [Cladochytrium replicatum]